MGEIQVLGHRVNGPQRAHHLHRGGEMAKSTCSVDGCDRSVYARTWCTMHYRRWRRHGDPALSFTLKGVPADERFALSYKVLPSGCWEWTKAIRGYGYGGFAANGKVYRAHRWAYERFVGPIPDGLHLDHTCHRPSECSGGESCPHRRCVNPAHLEPVTQRENTRRGHAGGGGRLKTHCIHGHEFTPENTRLTLRDGYTHRACRKCSALRALANYRRDPQSANRARSKRRAKAKDAN